MNSKYIEDYALIGNLRSAALVGRDGAIDWLCWPRFDSAACFAALLGDRANGRWLLAPIGSITHSQRQYLDGTLVLVTTHQTPTGEVKIIDAMSISEHRHVLVRRIEGVSGSVPIFMDLVLRFDYGATTPTWQRTQDVWVARSPGAAVALSIDTSAQIIDDALQCKFELAAGEACNFELNWLADSETVAPQALQVQSDIDATVTWWRNWSNRATCSRRWREAVERSLITLKALIYAPTGGIIAAPTTSLPEKLGGTRNWDYRYCWIRDAAFVLGALLDAGYHEEADAWRRWLLKAASAETDSLRVLYTIDGQRCPDEIELPHLRGYAQSRPVRVGNKANQQWQLDVCGELMNMLHVARERGVAPSEEAWEWQRGLIDSIERHWREPDNGIWEVRGPRRHFTHSKVMAWVAVDRAIKAVEHYQLSGDKQRWLRLRQEIHDDVCAHGYHSDRNTFVQHYGGEELDASLLLIPLVGFLPPGDHRVNGTIEAIERELLVDGLVRRYRTRADLEALDEVEGIFLICSFWLVDCMLLQGRRSEAEALFERLLRLRNDVGLLSEAYEPRTGHMLGNFPQALTHLALVNTAQHLST